LEKIASEISTLRYWEALTEEVCTGLHDNAIIALIYLSTEKRKKHDQGATIAKATARVIGKRHERNYIEKPT
jgi:hypothetical protein